MQNKDIDGFDLQIRSILEDAEVKPSRRVWRAVSASLKPAEAPVSRMWMPWAFAGAAAFAAIVAGLFLFNVPSGDTVVTASDVSLAELHTVAPSVIETEPADPQISVPSVNHVPSQGNVSSRNTIASRNNLSSRSDVSFADNVSHQESESTQVEASSQSESLSLTDVPSQGTVPVQSTVTKQESIPLIWEEETPRRARALQAYARGSIMTNESSLNFNSGKSYMSSGTAISGTGIQETGESSYGVPFSAGLGLRFYLTQNLSLGTGLNFSSLSRNFKGKYVNKELSIDETGDVSHVIDYLGIPLNLSFDFVSAKRVKVYAYLGGEAEYAISNRYRINASSVYEYSYKASGLQWSVGAGAGVEFRLFDWMGIYIDPGVKYYFNCNQPRNIRTDKPLLVNLDMGLRFNL